MAVIQQRRDSRAHHFHVADVRLALRLGAGGFERCLVELGVWTLVFKQVSDRIASTMIVIIVVEFEAVKILLQRHRAAEQICDRIAQNHAAVELLFLLRELILHVKSILQEGGELIEVS